MPLDEAIDCLKRYHDVIDVVSDITCGEMILDICLQIFYARSEASNEMDEPPNLEH